jgi:multiple sugar transport system substrate-binding protein
VVPPDSGDVTITWLADSITQGSNDPRQPLIDAFEDANPTIRVELTSGPSDTDTLRDTLRKVISNGRSVPDVYMGDVIWPATLGHEGLALPLSDHLPRTFWDRFPSILKDEATYGGKTYAAPFFVDQGLLYYRRDLLTREHMEVPTTWEQLAADASALQAKGLVPDGFVWQGDSYEGLTCVWTELMSDAGGRALNSGDTRSTIDSQQSLKALLFLRGLVTSQVTPPDVTRFQEPTVTDLLVTRQAAAFARAWPSTYGFARTSGRADEIGVAPLPSFAGGAYPGASTAGGWSLFINPHTAHLRAALTFVDWMTNVEAQDVLAGEYGVIPANAQVRSDPAIVALSPVLMVASRTTPTPRPANTPVYPEVSKAIFTNVNAAIAGRRSPEQALQAASQQIDRALRATG